MSKPLFALSTAWVWAAVSGAAASLGAHPRDLSACSSRVWGDFMSFATASRICWA